MLEISLPSAFHDLTARSTFNAAALAAFVLLGASNVNAQGLPPLDKVLNPAETALILVDFQYPFTNPAGANYHNVQKELDDKHLLDRTVDLVKKARSLGITVVHITEGYTHDYRELDPTNPGGFHRGQILRQAWKVGTKETSYYEPLQPGEGDKDLFLPPRNSNPPRSAVPVSIRCCVPRGSRTSPSPVSPPTSASMPRSPAPMTWDITSTRCAMPWRAIFPSSPSRC